MSEQTALQALELAGQGGARSTGVVFFGGEPLLHRELIVAVLGAAQQRTAAGGPAYHFKLTTNGLALDESFLALASEHDLHVAMSFDGVRRAHDRHRRRLDGSSCYDELLERLRLLLHHRPYASVLVVVNPDTAAMLSESIEYLLELGCRYLHIPVPVPYSMFVSSPSGPYQRDNYLDECRPYARGGAAPRRGQRGGQLRSP